MDLMRSSYVCSNGDPKACRVLSPFAFYGPRCEERSPHTTVGKQDVRCRGGACTTDAVLPNSIRETRWERQDRPARELTHAGAGIPSYASVSEQLFMRPGNAGGDAIVPAVSSLPDCHP